MYYKDPVTQVCPAASDFLVVSMDGMTSVVANPDVLVDPDSPNAQVLYSAETASGSGVRFMTIVQERRKLDGKPITAYSGLFMLNDSLIKPSEYKEKFNKTLVPGDKKYARIGGILIKETEIKGLVRADVDDKNFLVRAEFKGGGPFIVISNHLEVVSDTNFEFVVPESEVDKEDTSELQAFLKLVMYVGSKTALLLNKKPKRVGQFPPSRIDLDPKDIMSLPRLKGSDVRDVFDRIHEIKKEEEGTTYLAGSVQIRDPRVTFDMLGGLDAYDKDLRRVLIGLENPDIISRYGGKRLSAGLMLEGDPGSGKTALAEAIADKLGAKIARVDSSDILGGYVGESEQNLAKVFKGVQDYDGGKLVVVFDEADALFQKDATWAHLGVIGLFKSKMSDFEDNPNVLFIITTNSSDQIPNAILRDGRFGNNIYVKSPSLEQRISVIEKLHARIAKQAEENGGSSPVNDSIDIEKIAKACDGLMPVQIDAAYQLAIADRAIYLADEQKKPLNQRLDDESLLKIFEDDILNCIEEVRSRRVVGD